MSESQYKMYLNYSITQLLSESQGAYMHSLSLCDDPHVAVFSWVHRGSNELLHQPEGVPVGDVRWGVGGEISKVS